LEAPAPSKLAFCLRKQSGGYEKQPQQLSAVETRLLKKAPQLVAIKFCDYDLRKIRGKLTLATQFAQVA